VQGLHNTKYRVIGLCSNSAGLRGEVMAKGLGETDSSRRSALLALLIDPLIFAVRAAFRVKSLILRARLKLETTLFGGALSFPVNHALESKCLYDSNARKIVST